MSEFTVREIQAGTGGALRQGDPAARATGAAIDSRVVEAGDCFFAIRGPRHDGHRFLAEAFARGAAGAVVSEPEAAAPPDRFLIRTPDTTRALQELAGAVRRRRRPTVIAITGSCGKTGTKEITAALCGVVRPTLKSAGNLNNHYGLPLSLLGLTPAHRVAVLEAGISTPGEMDRLIEIAAPDLACCTNVRPVHTAYFPDVAAIAREKAKLLRAVPETGVAVFPGDDPLLAEALADCRATPATFGEGPDNVCRLRDWRPDGPAAGICRIEAGPYSGEYRLPLPGRYNALNFCAALLLVRELGATADQVREGLARLRPIAGRGVVVTLPSGITLLDDSYNANPAAVAALMELVQALPAGRKVAVLGDMLELGDRSGDAHAETGRRAAGAGIDLLVTVGREAERMAPAFSAAGGRQVMTCTNAEAAAAWLPTRLAPGDLVLVKGSRGVQLEKVVAALRGTDAAAGGD